MGHPKSRSGQQRWDLYLSRSSACMQPPFTSYTTIHEGNAFADTMNDQQVEPVIENQHFLLVTLLLCNACAMEALPLFLDRQVSFMGR